MALYVHEPLAYKERLDLTTNITSNDECVFADVQHCSFDTKVIHRTPMLTLLYLILNVLLLKYLSQNMNI